jgi:hypothetical protein
VSDDSMFTIMRFQILTFALTTQGRKKLDDAYVAGWADSVYPVLHNADWHKPFADRFKATEQMMDGLVRDLDRRWKAKTVPTYYELEGELCKAGKWDRGTLIYACRYVCLRTGAFDADFRSALMKERPSEASFIGEPFDRDSDLYFI